MLIAPLIALALIGFHKPAAIVINANVKDGDVISQEQTFRVTVQSDSPVTQVEFYVGDDLRDSDNSTPYEFKFDPLNEKDGDLKITFAAYTSQGDNVKKSFNIKIDTGVTKGPDFHIQRANGFLQQQKWDDAILSGRLALKAKPDSNPAMIIMARAYLGKGGTDDLVKAQEYAEKVLTTEKSNTEGLDLLAAINLQKAFNTYFKGSGDKNETIKSITTALNTAAVSRKKNLDAAVDNFGPITDENRIRYANVANRAGRYSLAISALNDTFFHTPKTNVGNLLVYSDLQANRIADALKALDALKKTNQMDAYSYALLAVIDSIKGDDSASDDAMKEAIGDDSENPGVQTAQAYIALRRGKNAAFSQLATSLGKEQGPTPEVNYYLSVLYNATGDYDRSDKKFQEAVLSEPALVDMYLERGNQALSMVAYRQAKTDDVVKYQFNVANAYFQAALSAKPDSGAALTANGLYLVLQGNTMGAADQMEAAINAAPEYTAGQYAAAMVFSSASEMAGAQADKIRKDAAGDLSADQKESIRKYNELASKYSTMAKKARADSIKQDPHNLEGSPFPRLSDVFAYYQRYGRNPVLTPPKG